MYDNGFYKELGLNNIKSRSGCSACAAVRGAFITGLVIMSAAVLILFFSGCKEKPTDLVEDNGSGGTVVDSLLPDGFVAVSRPADPEPTFVMPCPLGIIQDPVDNPYFIIDGFPEGIPAVDQPEFISIAKADPKFDVNERIIAIEHGGMIRGFPVRILLHHEVVNLCWSDPGGEFYSYLTYCPLVDGALHFNHDFPCFQPNAKRGKSFGVSGFLYNGNLVMYGRNTDDPQTGTLPGLYSQLYGGGVDGTCTPVEPVIFDMTWSMFKLLFPRGKVLSENTGFMPAGGYDAFQHPYSDYWRNNELFFPLSNEDARLKRKEPVYGVITAAGTKAYKTFGKLYVVNDNVGGSDIVVWNDPNFASTAGFERVVDGRALTFSFLARDKQALPLFKDAETGSIWTFDGIAVDGPLAGRRLAHLTALRVFWFAWASFYPATDLFIP